MKTTIKVDNIRCGSCANSIHKAMGALPGVFGISVDMVSGHVTADHTDEVSAAQLERKLASMGYATESSTKIFRGDETNIYETGCMNGNP